MRSVLLLMAVCGWAVAEEADGGKAEDKVPGVGAVISEEVANLPSPEAPAVPKGVTMAITAKSDEVQTAVEHGLTCLHGGWDLEAYRHFCEALKMDEQCLMAHWGVALSLLQADVSLRDEREAAIDRMLALIDEGVGTDLEKRYVFGLTKLISEGIGEASNAFAALAEAYPNDPQAQLFKSLLGRGGYDETGEITPDQKVALEEMRAMIERYPDLTYLRHALLAMMAEAPSLDDGLEMARELAAEAPDFAPYHHLLGHYEWRTGHHTRAQAAFARAAELYTAWMAKNEVSEVMCPGWTRAECYRAVCLASKGRYETALAVAEAVAAIEVDPEDANRPGARMLLWEGRTLPARILMRRDGDEDIAWAIRSLPAKEPARAYSGKSLVVWAWQMYSSVLAGRQALKDGEVEEAMRVSENVKAIGENFVRTRDAAVAVGERSEWLRAFKASEVMAAELLGLTAMAMPEGERGSAFNWYKRAIDRQSHGTLMMPPAMLLPMELRLAQYYADRTDLEGSEKWDHVVDILEAAQAKWPDDFEVLGLLAEAHAQLGESAAAAKIRTRIQEMEQE